MNITYLREFVEVALDLNLSKAARTLHVSQPSLSKHIAALEQECQAELFHRGASRVQLTPAGQILCQEALKLIRQHDEALQKVRAQKDATVLNLGGLCKNARVISRVNKAVAAMAAEGTQVSVAYQDYRHQAYDQLLLNGKIDVAFTILCSGERPTEGLMATHLFDDPMVCLVKRDSEFGATGRVSVRELEGRTIIQPVGSYSTEHGRSTVHAIFEHYGIAPAEQPVFMHSIFELACIENTEDLLIMERLMLDTQPFTDDYRVVEIEEQDACFAFHAVIRAEDNPVVARFVDALAQAQG